jgi:hypothetical protein
MTLNKKYIAGIIAVVLTVAYGLKRRSNATELEEFSTGEDQTAAADS